MSLDRGRWKRDVTMDTSGAHRKLAKLFLLAALVPKILGDGICRKLEPKGAKARWLKGGWRDTQRIDRRYPPVLICWTMIANDKNTHATPNLQGTTLGAFPKALISPELSFETWPGLHDGVSTSTRSCSCATTEGISNLPQSPNDKAT